MRLFFVSLFFIAALASKGFVDSELVDNLDTARGNLEDGEKIVGFDTTTELVHSDHPFENPIEFTASKNSKAKSKVVQEMITPAYDDTPFDSPLSDTEMVAPLKSNPDCSVRPQTISEIQRMRSSATKLRSGIQSEVSSMSKRKSYIEQMTGYINDRIRDLNKVKGELRDQLKWVEASNDRITELSEREKLVKHEDILACLQEDNDKMESKKKSQAKISVQLQGQASALEAKIAEIKKHEKAIKNKN